MTHQADKAHRLGRRPSLWAIEDCQHPPYHDGMNTSRKRARRAFWDGFWKGLSSTTVLFEARHLTEIEPIAPVNACKRSDRDTLRQDWEMIGGDFRVAIKKARQEASR